MVLYRDVPASDAEMVRRIGDADAVLLSYTSRMGKEVIAQCPNIRYIGMCCSLYSEESANVDIAYARTRGIQVLGIRDYGDRGVVEYVLHELTGLLHGFGMPMLRDEPVEITGLKVGIVGLGVSGRMIADALQFMGAEISYFARSAKPDAEAAGMTYKPLAQLLADSEVVFTCLNKNVLLLGENEFAQLGAGKVLFNTSIGPGFDSAALEKWLDLPDTHFFCDTRAAAGPVAGGLFRENVYSQCVRRPHQAGLRSAEQKGAGQHPHRTGRISSGILRSLFFLHLFPDCGMLSTIKREPAQSGLRVGCTALTCDLIWIMPT